MYSPATGAAVSVLEQIDAQKQKKNYRIDGVKYSGRSEKEIEKKKNSHLLQNSYSRIESIR